tara:strand:+ start:671 stop:1819 length:1149 start_codon:yes stop_codon:yes gene_type:complete
MQNISNKYSTLFGRKAELLARAPGRINLIGEHTDYNKGFVLPAAIDKHMFFAFGKNKEKSIELYSYDLDEKVTIESLEKLENNTWANFIIGILQVLKNKGLEIRNFNMVFGGNIPIGGGLSSSSALECGFLKILNQAYDLGLDHMEMIEISRSSNHHFLELQGGIMDQFSVLNGIADHAMLLNCETHEYSQIPLRMNGYSFVLIDSNVSHSLVNSAYNDRVREGKEALTIIQKKYPKVRHLSMATLAQIDAVEKSLSLIQKARARFIIEENRRVHKFCAALAKKDIGKVGNLIYASHEGLRDQYQVSCKEVDLLVDLAKKSEGVIGARMIGGGFGGCTLNLIESKNALTTAQKISSSYKAITGISSKVYDIKIGDGVSVFEN